VNFPPWSHLIRVNSCPFVVLNSIHQAKRHLHGPVDIASLAAFRILFGLLLAAAMTRFLAKGWVQELYVLPAFHFPYPGFAWVRPWPGPLMHLHFVLLVVAAIGIAAGFYYRICITLFFLGFTYVELIDQTTYLNHYYLISLICGIMIFLPAHRAWSFDAWRRPGLRADTVPAWTLNLLRFQVSVVYVFAGLAKLNTDWLLNAQPLRTWLAARSDLALVGPMLSHFWVASLASWIGAAYDLSIVAFLIYRRTRGWAYLAVVIFHVATLVLFRIGMFPWVMIVATLLFFSPSWPRICVSRIGEWLSGGDGRPRAVAPHAGLPCTSLSRPRLTTGLLAAYASVQLALPLRPYFMEQPSAWTGHGFNFSWRVMLAEKTGFIEFYACDPATGQRWKERTKNYLTRRQEVMMAQDPDLIRVFARHLAKDLRAQGHGNVQIKVDSFATLNGRPSQRLIDPEANLAGSLAPGWIMPLQREPTAFGKNDLAAGSGR
jgi:vitamin K-dependent gamma-carboxylase